MTDRNLVLEITKKDIWVYVNYGGYGVTEVENL